MRGGARCNLLYSVPVYSLFPLHCTHARCKRRRSCHLRVPASRSFLSQVRGFLAWLLSWPARGLHETGKSSPLWSLLARLRKPLLFHFCPLRSALARHRLTVVYFFPSFPSSLFSLQRTRGRSRLTRRHAHHTIDIPVTF